MSLECPKGCRAKVTSFSRGVTMPTQWKPKSVDCASRKVNSQYKVFEKYFNRFKGKYTKW